MHESRSIYVDSQRGGRIFGRQEWAMWSSRISTAVQGAPSERNPLCVAQVTHAKLWGSEERLERLRAIYVNFWNFKGWRQFVLVCQGISLPAVRSFTSLLSQKARMEKRVGVGKELGYSFVRLSN